MEDYEKFIESKKLKFEHTGIPDHGEINPMLYDWQRDVVSWALRRGRASLFEDCGLGKTPQQLEWAKHVEQHTESPVLILAPVAVSQQTISEGQKFGVDVARADDGSDIDGRGIYITNYERLHKFNPTIFGGVVLDESSILKSFTGKIRNQIIDSFEKTPFRLACTATPSPNDHSELGNHAEFLGVMTRKEMLATFFVHDSSTSAARGWRLKQHAEDEFWEWVATWAVSIKKPSDIGYDDDRFDLPELNVRDHIVDVDHRDNDADTLIRLPAASLSELRTEQRKTVPQRCEQVAELANESDEPWIVWCHRNDESSKLTSLIDDAVEVTGSHDSDTKADRMLAFSDGDIRVLVTKPSIAGFGMNWQHCKNVAFVGLTHSYEQFYQAVRRCWRFGQNRPVDCHVVVAETQTKVLDSIQRKQQDAEKMNRRMVDAMASITITEVKGEQITETEDYRTDTETGDGWTLHLADCMDVVSDMDDESIDVSVYSPPFADLYTYTNSYRDMGNCSGDDEFIEHYEYLIKQLHRVTTPGRISIVHCMDLTATKSREGYIGLRDFPGSIIRAHERNGWIWHSKVTIWKDPVTAMQRTKAHGLLYKTLRKDSSRSRQGIADYLLIFRKPGENPKPIEHTEDEFPLDEWRKLASPTWDDIDQTDVLNNYREARAEEDEKHVCPLQLEVIRRALRLWSAPDDLVYDPFTGIGSSGYVALDMGRRFVGSELKKSYFDQAKQNLIDITTPDRQTSLI